MTRELERVSADEVADIVGEQPQRLETPLVVTARGEEVAVLMSRSWFTKLLREREVLRRLALGDLEFTAGEGHPLAEVLEDCDFLLDES